MIVANAHPKCGTNLIKKILGGLGLTHKVGEFHRWDPRQELIYKKGDGSPLRDVVTLDDGFFVHGHVCYSNKPLPDGVKMVTCIRDPKNALVSWCRWAVGKYGVVFDEQLLLTAIDQGVLNSGPWVESWHKFYPEGIPNCVRFEELCSDGGASIRWIAEYIGRKDNRAIDAVYAGLYGDDNRIDGRPVDNSRPTWSGQWSDWHQCKHWTTRVDSRWNAHMQRLAA